MGLMTNITILNDTLHEISADPVTWWNNVYNQICSTELRESNLSNDTTVNSVEHADTTTIIAVGGNCSTVLGRTYHNRHSSKEDQIKILEDLADNLGYHLEKN